MKIKLFPVEHPVCMVFQIPKTSVTILKLQLQCNNYDVTNGMLQVKCNNSNVKIRM